MFALCRDVILMSFVFAGQMLAIALSITSKMCPLIGWHESGALAAPLVHVACVCVCASKCVLCLFIASMSWNSWENYLKHGTSCMAVYYCAGVMELFCVFRVVPTHRFRDIWTTQRCQCGCLDAANRFVMKSSYSLDASVPQLIAKHYYYYKTKTSCFTKRFLVSVYQYRLRSSITWLPKYHEQLQAARSTSDIAHNSQSCYIKCNWVIRSLQCTQFSFLSCTDTSNIPWS